MQHLEVIRPSNLGRNHKGTKATKGAGLCDLCAFVVHRCATPTDGGLNVPRIEVGPGGTGPYPIGVGTVSTPSVIKPCDDRATGRAGWPSSTLRNLPRHLTGESHTTGIDQGAGGAATPLAVEFIASADRIARCRMPSESRTDSLPREGPPTGHPEPERIARCRSRSRKRLTQCHSRTNFGECAYCSRRL